MQLVTIGCTESIQQPKPDIVALDIDFPDFISPSCPPPTIPGVDELVGSFDFEIHFS